jgi:predicted aspartyl protease
MLIFNRFPYLEVVISIGTWSIEEEVYIDTGFDGGLLIPSYLRHEILASPGRSKLKVANDVVVEAPTWSGKVELGDQIFLAEIAAMGSRYLIGRDILDQLDIRLEFGACVHIRGRD